MNKTLSFVIVGIFLVLSLGFANASTLVTGIVYNSDFSSVINDASVTISCDLETTNTDSGNGTFNKDGIFAIIFTSNCTSISVSAVKGDLFGSVTAVRDSCNLGNCSTDYVAIANPSISAPVINSNTGGSSGSSSGGSGGSSGSFYLCGNGICNSGETTSTCPQDCPLIDNTSSNETSEEVVDEGTEQSARRGITGAVIGAVTSTGGVIVIVLIVLLGGSIGMYLSRKKRLAKN